MTSPPPAGSRRIVIVAVMLAAILAVVALRFATFKGAGDGDLDRAHELLCEADDRRDALREAREAARQALRAQPTDPHRVLLFQAIETALSPGVTGGSTQVEALEHRLATYMRERRHEEAREILATFAPRDGMSERRIELWLELIARQERVTARGCSADPDAPLLPQGPQLPLAPRD